MRVDCRAAARPRNAAATRDAILAAARARFLRESYDSVGLREIAGDAGVDVALVGRYFGSKEGLFVEVLGDGKADWLPPSSEHDLPALLAEIFMNQDEAEHRDHTERLLMILRSASSPVAAGAAHQALLRDLQPLADRLSGDAPETRASLAMAVYMGVTILRSIMAVEPVCDGECHVLKSKLPALYEAALSAFSAQPGPAGKCGASRPALD